MEETDYGLSLEERWNGTITLEIMNGLKMPSQKDCLKNLFLMALKKEKLQFLSQFSKNTTYSEDRIKTDYQLRTSLRSLG
ncbi:MAG: hypothetical protein A3H37_09755 [Candidatus Schekmanbacteria bacterium RIFCSPLOWO2_02_FULL_38_14]|uniref:Uncharacterized protein n=1 Tax=Candidatus Schekmanbacteria bacterium RIFCSPLOWO2_12_FULL_38_15 TaxID=1817883 RepID=A0A1F7SHY7_9BACT|nr:MAG: hypothetical protein A3H37_09755 [Candidatus Schekmanbacteria bacterium RIFCSPLOWO2_02_FULL_38_14]OGL52777.1 MAG: hypothetical protein A3G31_00045 [Candidatus Schekmanbacteria bacterium RIFCSPLOWO2_12_FULL_38_15]